MTERISITPSVVMEYLYCPRFIYFMSYLKIPQREENRYKVQLGKSIHQKKSSINKNYFRKKIGVQKKLIEQKMYSKKYNIHGIVDEVLFLKDGTAASLDYKFSKYRKNFFRTQTIQATMYGLLIKDNFKVEVNKGYIVYIRSKNLLKKIDLTDKLFEEVNLILQNVKNIIQKGIYPDSTDYKSRCRDCTYRNICIK